MISVCLQGKPFNIRLIQVYVPTSNADEAEFEWFRSEERRVGKVYVDTVGVGRMG